MIAEGLSRRFGRVRRRQHHSDEELLALIEHASADAHLSSCERCATRHAELLGIIAEVDSLNAEADAVFDEQRLAHQRSHILRRLERNHGPARVLPFPAAAGASAGLASFSRRWIAAAAIGGLVVGIFTGGILRHSGDGIESTATRIRSVESRLPDAVEVVTADFRSAPDELLLSELETAVVARPIPAELVAIDEFTPIAR